MNLYESGNTENDPVYRRLAAANNARYYGFVRSIVEAAIGSGKLWLSQSIIKAINFHAIVGLHYEAGRYRSHDVTVGDYAPPPHYLVEPLMDELVNEVNRSWGSADATRVATYALWRVNAIHPFVNGNGRTARAVCYFVLCVRKGGLLSGGTVFLEAMGREPVRTQYIEALRQADEGDELALVELVGRLAQHQIREDAST